ncbi:MAG TPA: acetylxylan esterase [Planctomycetaceae bacterium]|nr:acetylxylan esterase [Planctomycetaceae bacterium]
MPKPLVALFLLLSAATTLCAAEIPRALPAGTLPKDSRLQPPKDLNGYFPFQPPQSKEEWAKRAELIRRRVLVSQGLWPLPTRSPLNVVIHGKIEKEDYTVEKAYFESVPGLYVTGNLYRPKNVQGAVPAVLFAHGHWQDARLSEETEDNLRKEIATGAERFEKGGRSRFQSMCVQLARMGCVVWQWDMLSDSDSKQISREIVHTFAKQRPEMNTVQNWGLYSPQAEAHLQSVMGLQTWNAVRSLDFVLGLSEVDPKRIAITGASGGGTQTMLLAAIDPRVSLSFPAVMVSTAMQGGCTCENASLLRIGTGNVEFAALFAPKPQGMTTADDWTKEMATKGFPELKQLYATLGAADNVMLHRGEHFPHNYNAVARAGFYAWLNRHFKLGLKEPVIERDFDPLTRDQLTVWDAQHPAPMANDADLERRVLNWLDGDAERQLKDSATALGPLRKTVGAGLEVVLGRTFASAGSVEWDLKSKQSRDSWVEMTGLLRNKTYGEEVPVTFIYPKNWNQKVVVWLTGEGKSGLWNAEGALKSEVRSLVEAGTTVIGADLLYQGEFLENGQPLTQVRTVANSREAAAYTFGYNPTLFAQRAHDVLTIVRYLRTTDVDGHPRPSRVSVAGFGAAGPVAAAAWSVAQDSIDRLAVDTQGFRFGKLLDYRDPQFLPGGAKYLDLPGMLAVGGRNPLWLAGESVVPEVVAGIYAQSSNLDGVELYRGEPAQQEAAAARWLLK